MSQDTKTASPLDAIESTDFLARYRHLCAIRDKVNKANEPLEAKLADLVAQQEKLRVEAEKISGQIDDNRGREKWVALKREIRILAAGLGKIPPESPAAPAAE